jgi:uncharacterized protein (TIGR02597 family)
VSGTPGWTLNQFATTATASYLLILDSGAKEGLWGTVTANAAGTVTVTFPDASDSLTGVVAGDSFSIRQHWTPLSILGNGVPAGSEVYTFSDSAPGVNPAPGSLLYFDGTNWVDQNDFVTILDHKVVSPGEGLMFRNSSASPVTVSIVGAVPMTKHRVVLRSSASAARDTFVLYNSPVPANIATIGLGFSDGDEAYVFNNSETGFNKAPTTLLYFDGTTWLDQNTFAAPDPAVMVQPGSAIVFRKAGTPSATSFVWASLQPYLAP